MLELQNICFEREGRKILDDISLKLDSNNVTVTSNGTNNNVNSNMFCDAPYFRN